MKAGEKAATEVLKRQQFDQSNPGTILADFETLLNFIGPNGLKTGGKNYRIPITALNDLDERMTNPLRPKLTRPQQLSFPHLNGLYLLLRASGMGVTSGSGTSGLLSISAKALAQWNELNPVERYFTLFEALMTGQWEVIDSEGGSGGPWNDCEWRLGGWSNGEPLTEAGQPASKYFYSWRQQTSVALMELFGIMEIGRAEAKQNENWRINRIALTDFGNALLARLRGMTVEEMAAIFLDDEDSGDRWAGELFQDCYPDCQNTLVLDDDEFVDGIWQFKVSWHDVWRRILVPARSSCDDLVFGILKEFKFDDDHLYEFELRNRSGRKIRIGVHDAEYYTDEYLIGSLPLDPGQSMTFVFDFGDNWRFDVKLEKVLPPDSKIKKVRVTEGKGKPPKQYNYDEDW